MNRDQLETALVEQFEASPATARVVGRQASDLADAGLVAEDLGFELTADAVLDELRDAPEDHDAVERWNWWLGSLELSHGGYERFTVRPDDP